MKLNYLGKARVELQEREGAKGQREARDEMNFEAERPDRRERGGGRET